MTSAEILVDAFGRVQETVHQVLLVRVRRVAERRRAVVLHGSVHVPQVQPDAMSGRGLGIDGERRMLALVAVAIGIGGVCGRGIGRRSDFDWRQCTFDLEHLLAFRRDIPELHDAPLR